MARSSAQHDPHRSCAEKSICLRTSNLRIDEINIDGDEILIRDRRLRSRFAMRFGAEKTESEKDAKGKGKGKSKSKGKGKDKDKDAKGKDEKKGKK